MFFRKLSDWQHLLELLPHQPDSYFCDKSAYGSCIAGRSIELAPSFFAAEPVCRRFFQAHADISGRADFVKFYDFLTSKENTALLPQCGPLISMLFAGDLCMAGLLNMPSPAEMATIVTRVGKGALKGLYHCKLTFQEASTSAKEQAFVRSYDFMDAALSDAEKSEIVWNTLTHEHILCKIRRLAKKRAS